MGHLEDRCSHGNRREPAPRAGRRPGPGQAVGWAEAAGAQHPRPSEHPGRSGAGRGPVPTGKKARRCCGHAHKGGARRPGGFAEGSPRGPASEGSSGRARGEGPVPPPALGQLALPAGLWRVLPPTRTRCTHLSPPRASERRGRGARPGHAFSCIVVTRESPPAGGRAWIGREAEAVPALGRPRPASHPRSAGPASRRCGAMTGRGPGPSGPAPTLNIDAARVGVALLPLSEAVSRGPASA